MSHDTETIAERQAKHALFGEASLIDAETVARQLAEVNLGAFDRTALGFYAAAWGARDDMPEMLADLNPIVPDAARDCFHETAKALRAEQERLGRARAQAEADELAIDAFAHGRSAQARSLPRL